MRSEWNGTKNIAPLSALRAIGTTASPGYWHYCALQELGLQKRDDRGDFAAVEAGRMGMRSAASFAISVSLFC